MYDIAKNKTVDLRVSDISGVAWREARCHRVANLVSRLRDSQKQGKLGLDVGAPHVALYSCMRKRGNGVDEPKSPKPFSNEIRAGIHDDRQ